MLGGGARRATSSPAPSEVGGSGPGPSGRVAPRLPILLDLLVGRGGPVVREAPTSSPRLSYTGQHGRYGAGGDGPGEAVRGQDGRRRHLPGGRAGHGDRDPGTERGRQDHPGGDLRGVPPAGQGPGAGAGPRPEARGAPAE